MNKIILLFLIILILSIGKKNVEGYNERNICRGKLSDKDYLNHMIPHHQVAIDISYKLQEISKSPVMHDILRKLIWTQETEIKIIPRFYIPPILHTFSLFQFFLIVPNTRH